MGFHRPTLVPPAPEPSHATRARYRRGCRCYGCRLAQSAHERDYRERLGAGERRMVPGHQVLAAAAAQQRAYGLSEHALLAAAGVGNSTLWKMRRDPQRPVLQRTLHKIEELPYLDQVHWAWVGAGGTVVRLRAMAVLGWSLSDVARLRGLTSRIQIRPKDGREQRRLRLGDVHTYIDLLAKCEVNAPGPTPLASKRALAAGWLGPQAYDRDVLVDPFWDGEGGLLRPGGLQGRVEELRWLLDGGVGREEAARRCGWKSWEIAVRTVDPATCTVRRTVAS